MTLFILVVLSLFALSTAFRPMGRQKSASTLMAGPKPLHPEFTVQKATPEQLKEMGVSDWPTWSTEGSPKYQVGIQSPLKVYDCWELSYIISGSMEIIPEATGKPVLVQAGDFVTFPNEFPCHWKVIEPVNKHWYCYMYEKGVPVPDR